MEYIRTYRLESRLSKTKTIKYEVIGTQRRVKVEYCRVRITKYGELFGAGSEIMKRKLVLRYILGLECSENLYKHYHPLSVFFF